MKSKFLEKVRTCNEQVWCERQVPKIDNFPSPKIRIYFLPGECVGPGHPWFPWLFFGLVDGQPPPPLFSPPHGGEQQDVQDHLQQGRHEDYQWSFDYDDHQTDAGDELDKEAAEPGDTKLKDQYNADDDNDDNLTEDDSDSSPPERDEVHVECECCHPGGEVDQTDRLAGVRGASVWGGTHCPNKLSCPLDIQGLNFKTASLNLSCRLEQNSAYLTSPWI